MDKTHIRIIGDIHQHDVEYRLMIKGIPYSVQLGDYGFSYKSLADVDSTKHRIVMGNHDNYDNPSPHSLGDFGVHSFPLDGREFKFFFVRGAYSVDQCYRIEGRSWWRNEELNWDQSNACIDAWQQTKPEIVFSHDCPGFIVPIVATNKMKIKPSLTNRLLEALFSMHEPKLWIFGHHHQNKVMSIRNTTFMALSGACGNRKAGYVDFDKNGELIGEPQ